MKPCLICGKPTDGTYGGQWPLCFDCYTTADPATVIAKDKEVTQYADNHPKRDENP